MDIEAIIFDFGGVILDIDPKLTMKEFEKLGARKLNKDQTREFVEKIVAKFERGIFTPEVFRTKIKEFLKFEADDNQIDDAWNALLYDIPAERIRVIEQVRNNYRIFLLSNSNEVHYDLYVRDLQLRFGYREFDELFEKSYFSFDTHLSKPNPEAFEFIINQEELTPSKTLFIDDRENNIKAASSLGLRTYLLKPPERIRDIFKDGMLKKDLKIG
ncbi:MAG: HAD family phosphatase [Chlorobi bacterium]|nr:HAD family phosphatase [Chlorobiota bacterium]